MKTKSILFAVILLSAFLLAGCGQSTTEPIAAEVDYQAEAARLAQKILVIDTHIDLPYRLKEHMEDVSVQTEEGHFDLVRAEWGGLDAAFMSIYIPASLQEEGGGRELGDELIDLVEGIQEQAGGGATIARSVAEIRSNFEKGVFSLPMGIENGAAIEDDLTNLQHFYDRGVRYITLSHSEDNLICDSSYSEKKKWQGLSPFGREVISEMNRLGIMVDVSHVTDETFLHVMEIATAPVIASHSCARHFTPGFERNLPDELIAMLADNGGVLQIAYAPGFLSEAAQRQSTELWAIMREFIAENGGGWDSDAARERIALFYEENPKVLTGVEDVVDHIEHVINLVGIDHVGVGSDYDGISDTPIGLEDVSTYPNLIEELLRRGYSEQDIRKIFGENLLRVWSEVERVAQETQAS